MVDEHVEFFKTAFVQKQGEPLASGQLALGVLVLDALPASTQPCRTPALDKILDFFLLYAHLVYSSVQKGRIAENPPSLYRFCIVTFLV